MAFVRDNLFDDFTEMRADALRARIRNDHPYDVVPRKGRTAATVCVITVALLGLTSFASPRHASELASGSSTQVTVEDGNLPTSEGLDTY